MKLYMKRMCAYLIDLVIAVVLCNLFLFSYKVFLMDPEMASKANYMLLCALLTIFFLFIYLPTKQDGQTIGKALFHLRVVNINGKKRTWFQSFLRECVMKFSFIMFLVPLDILYTLIESVKARRLVLCVGHDMLLNTDVR
ncbi:RDD family protein [[Eubacterium] hominis]|uniref:RDD family protein n=1 Tax=[Eubacterium] hominis TaxID=2764325 RepID=UPI003A4E28FA